MTRRIARLLRWPNPNRSVNIVGPIARPVRRERKGTFRISLPGATVAAGESGISLFSAEGATRPETLRQRNGDA